ncbi:ABC transporter ATP-binding protein [Kallotenue papyrolyticum]|uniref:ABC transporter ATP-binding protein n=1 Tax=Kallotenue papyrolyticum TaxID=1325125 RepID=UPI0004786031|nr:ABC transporter ATP-binding protein [Kallotenue papyrolyticum]
MIEAHDLHKYFGTFHAVRGLSLTVAPGQVLALLGPNGAGKTTTIRMLAAILRPDRGTARVAGHDVVAEPRQVRQRVGLLTEYPGLYARMTAVDYLLFFGRLQGMSQAQCVARITQLLHHFDLWHARERTLDGYSKGMKQKVALIRAMLHDPPVLFLDEPTTAMDPQSARQVRDAIAHLRDARRSIVLCTHNLSEAEELADTIAVVRGGQIVAAGTHAELMQQLLGDPLWELRLAQPLNGQILELRQMVTIEDWDATWLRFRTRRPAETNPALLRRLHALGVPVISLSEVPRSLEAVYLRIVGEQPKEQPSAGEDAP